ncbi:hypothetical protein D8X55_00815 [Malacoplasma penetrans]|uniref:Uncharacterized protein n=1 Tax=Malacoplasma penetrans (strain HF-2) TaxID=272633 RepID=Q8EVX5_MALP2|nr:hypothetical protein [Malacoplasma penetrans]RXY97227.1 hypothetical protein D8X55_00815 [Malacoplasma penetrans]BAC44224.1 hypothetical protein [Malacoplasma penetrans HF-2]
MKLNKKLLIGSVTTLGAMGVGTTVVTSLAKDESTSVVPLSDSLAQKNLSEVGVVNDANNNSRDKEVNVVVAPKVSAETKEVAEVKNDATAPADNTVIESGVVTEPVTNNNELNKFLKDNFEQSVKPTFKGYFQNVEISYKEGSAKFDDRTFQIKVKPADGHAWENKTNNEKEISVYLPNMSSLADIKIGSQKVITYSGPRMDFTSSSNLNNYLKSNFSEKNLKSVTFTNVDKIEYVEGSAKLAGFGSSLFSIRITPKIGAVWYNKSYQPRTIPVLFASAVAVTSVQSFDKFNYQFSAADVWSKETFNSKLTELFKNQNSVKSNFSGDYSNVNLKYVDGSANYEKGEFQVTATPGANFLWSDYTKGQKTITVSAPNIQRFNTPLPVKVGGSRTSLIVGTPWMSLKGKNKEFTTYEAHFTLRGEARDFGWTTIWSYSNDNGKTWISKDLNGLKSFHMLSKNVKSNTLLKFQIMFNTRFATSTPYEGYAMTFNAV